MGNNTISQKIDAYAQANLKALKQEEAKTGRKMTKFDIAQYMLQHGKLNKNEYANWMNTTEGFNAQAMTQQQKTALKQGSVWGFAGYGGGQESYLDSMTSFSQKTPVEKQNAISGHQMKLNETVAERKKKAAEMQKEIKQQQVTNQILNPNQALKEQKFKDHISSLPEVDATYTELMNDIKFQNMDKKQKTEFLLKTTGQKFYEAKERGDKEAMKEYLKQGIGLTFAYMDDKAGITDIKEDAKEFYGLNAFVDTIDKFVDDGDDSNLSFGEKTWETIKGVGDAVDGFIGMQGAAFMGTLAVAGEAAAAAGIGKAFALVTQVYFAYEGGTMVVDGAVDVANAQTKEEARVGGQELGTGAIMLGGAAKSVKQVRRNIKNQKAEEFVKTATDKELRDEHTMTRIGLGDTGALKIYEAELNRRGFKPDEFGMYNITKIKAKRPNGKTIDVAKDIPQKVLTSKTTEHLRMPDATTVKEEFGVTITQAKAAPVEAKRIVFAETVEETLRVNNENGIPLKFEANPPEGEAPYFYKDAPYGGRQKVNTQSLEVTYNYDAEESWGVTPEYIKEYGNAEGKCPDRAVVAAGDDAVTGLKGNIAEKQYEIINPDGSRSPLDVASLKPGEMVHIIKKAGVELKMAVFDKPTTSLEGEKLPTDKLMMIDSEGHPYNGIPVKRLRSGEVEMQFDTSDPVQAKMQNTLNEIKDLDAQTKAAKKADNKDLAGQLKSKAEALVTEFETQLTEFVKDKQTNNTQTAKKAYVKPEITQQRLATEEDVMSSAFEKPIWKNTVISKTARADVKYVKEQYGLDIDVLRDNKVKIGNEVFDNKQGFDKGDIAKLVKAAYSEQCKNLPSNLPEGSSELLCEIYAKKFQSNYKNAAINKLPIELKDEVSEWFDNNFKPKASIEWAGGKRYLYSSDRGTFTHSKGITYADYDAEGAANFRPMLAVKLDILAKRGYEIKLHGEDGRNDSYLSDIEITAPDGKVAHCGVFLEAVSNAIDMALQDIANGIEHPKIGR